MCKPILLIGMMGCGKSTIGRLLAGRMGLPLIDLDEEIARAAGKSIPEIFAEEGDAGFRLHETAALGRALDAGEAVIATGGGIVTREENIRMMREKGFVVWLCRPLEENIAKSKLVADYARARGVLVEAEVGQILGRSDEGSCDKAVYSVTQDDCIRMATETGITSLAIGIGNRHGFYDKKPNLNIALLADVHRELPIPLVLHGSSGLEDAVVKECIRNGISKVNVGTALHYAYKQKVAEVIDVEKKNYAVTSFAVPAKEAIKDVVRTWIRVCGAEGKAL
mgnify:CR=1 FL=1